MRIEALRYLIELDRAGSMYGGAKHVMVSQQGFSKAIRSLEHELGVALVRRGPNGTKLTSDGEIVLESARRIVAEHDRMLARIFVESDAALSEDQRITVYVSHYAAHIASMDPAYVHAIGQRTTYIEEPFEKLFLRAEASTGSDLIFLDLHPDSAEKLKQHPNVSFAPVMQTRYGLIWKPGASIEGKTSLHRQEVCDLPIAIDANRELNHFADKFFGKIPLTDVRISVASSRMMLEYVLTSGKNAVALCDSLSYFLMENNDMIDPAVLRFTPFSERKAICQIGYLLNRREKLTPLASHCVDALKHFASENCPDYTSPRFYGSQADLR